MKKIMIFLALTAVLTGQNTTPSNSWFDRTKSYFNSGMDSLKSTVSNWGSRLANYSPYSTPSLIDTKALFLPFDNSTFTQEALQKAAARTAAARLFYGKQAQQQVITAAQEALAKEAIESQERAPLFETQARTAYSKRNLLHDLIQKTETNPEFNTPEGFERAKEEFHLAKPESISDDEWEKVKKRYIDLSTKTKPSELPRAEVGIIQTIRYSMQQKARANQLKDQIPLFNELVEQERLKQLTPYFDLQRPGLHNLWGQ